MAGLAAGALAVPEWLGRPASAGEWAPNSLTGGTPLRVAMHVHASWSEEEGSWAAQFQQAAANAFDVLYLTDHDYKARAVGCLPSLAGLVWTSSSTGTFSHKAGTVSGGSLRLVAESASATAPAALTMQVEAGEPRSKVYGSARNQLRAAIAGTTLTQQITTAALGNGATYEIVVTLSYRPPTAGRAAGQYQLVYRFGVPPGRWTEGGGLIGVVGAPAPAAGSVQVLDLTADVAALWPDIVAIDNSLYGLALVATSPRRGAPADINIASITIDRSQTSDAAILANQATIVSAYRTRYPTVTAYPQIEISTHDPHITPFGIPQWLPDYGNYPHDPDTLYRQMVSAIHAQGGIVSYNHPFGTPFGPPLPPADRDATRRALFASMNAVHLFRADILEVGYRMRGHADAATHLALWDTFSRNGTFLTGTGVTDDHHGQDWPTLLNTFLTGIWARSRSNADLAAALRRGRAYAIDLRLYPHGALDLLADGTVAMGQVSVSTKTTRRLTLYAANLPAGATVQLLAGPVDYAGHPDPGTTAIRTYPASAMAGGTITTTVNTATDRFYRLQVLSPTGDIIGIGNPIWLLRHPPPGGIPGPRR